MRVQGGLDTRRSMKAGMHVTRSNLACRLAGVAAAALGSGVHGATVFSLSFSFAGQIHGVTYGPPEFEMTGTPVSDGMRLNARLGPLPASEYVDPFVIGSGTMEGQIRPGDRLRVTYALRAQYPAGQVRIETFSLSGALLAEPGGKTTEDIYCESGALPIAAPSGQVISGSFETQALSVGGPVGDWSAAMFITWTGSIAPTDEFSIELMPQGLRVQVVRGGPPCPGDANADRRVDFLDLNIVLGQYGQSAFPGELAGDLDANGVVDFVDLNAVLSAYATTC